MPWPTIIGNRVPLNLGPRLLTPANRVPLNLGVEWFDDIVVPPEPEIIGNLVAGAGMRWGGLATRQLVAARWGWGGALPLVQQRRPAWGATQAQVARLAVVWGGLAAQRTAMAFAWGAGRANALARLQAPWGAIPPVLNGTGVRWGGFTRAAQALALPWTVPPSHARHAGIRWGGMVPRLRIAGTPWTAPPKVLAGKRIPWGYGHGLEWVVLPPPVVPPAPPPAQPLDGRYIGLNLGCHVVGVPGVAPLNLGVTACFVVRRQHRAFVVLNEIEVVRLPDLLPIAVDAVSISGSRDAWCWDAQLQLADPAQLAAVQPTGAGPRQLRITVNGYSWVIAVEAFGRERVWGQTQVSVSGRSVSAQLAEPYAAARSGEEAAARTMHQLAEAEVTGSDVALTYDAVDWLVTGGAWYYEGQTPMAALLRIAQASGAVVQSHPADPEVRIAPRYPASPWQWTSTAPDAEIQDDIVTGERLQLQSRPNYDAVIVAGERVGVAARVIVDGEAGQTYAPQQIDQLITHADGARERGRNTLADRGGQAAIEQDIPLFPAPLGSGQPGLVLPLQLVRRVAADGTWHGLCTGVRISATRQDAKIDVVQTVTLERHYTDAD